MRNGDVSFWFSQLDPEPLRPGLDGDLDVDVAVVGAGLTGLWSAYHLLAADPTLRVAVLEARHAGYGASGRNGGWVANTITGGRETDAARLGRPAVARFQRVMNRAVARIGEIAAAEGIDADYVRGGELVVARGAAQGQRLRAAAADAERWPEDEATLLDAAGLGERVRIAGARGGLFVPHCARIHPARLVRGLARVVEQRGAHLFEDTRVTRLEPAAPGRRARAVTERGTVTADVVLRCTEGFTAGLAGQRRTWLPMNSSMIVTEPLPGSVWEEIGWDGMETIEDLAHGYVYLQRTADGRIAIGGRGRPYRFGSRTDTDGETPRATVMELAAQLRAMFPATRGTGIEHTWSGVLGVPRDWRASVGLDPGSGMGWAGGYVGTGVTATHVAGATLADLVLGRDTELTGLPWVGRKVRRWEPEPLRWLAVQGMYALYRAADRAEDAGGGTRWWAGAADRLTGRALPAHSAAD